MKALLPPEHQQRSIVLYLNLIISPLFIPQSSRPVYFYSRRTCISASPLLRDETRASHLPEKYRMTLKVMEWLPCTEQSLEPALPP